MGFAYLIAGFVFLMNPSISIIDLLPDFIGYACILKGLSKVSKLSADFESAHHDFRTLFLLTLARLLTLPLAGGSDQTWLLLIVFCFGLVEAFLSCRAFAALFEGFSYTAERGEGQAVFKNWSETRLITFIFMIVRQVLCILPELSLLSTDEYGEVSANGVQSLAKYRLTFTLIAAILSLIFGIYWFIRIRGYLKAAMADQPYMEMLEGRYCYTVGENPAAMRRYALRFSLNLLTAAAVLSVELPFDGFNYLPHTLFALLITVAAYHLRPYYSPNAQKTARWSLIYTIVSAVVWVYNLIYMRHIFGAMLDSEEEGLTLSYATVLSQSIKKDFAALDGFILLCVLVAIEAIFFAILVKHLTDLLNHLLLQHIPQKEDAPVSPEEAALQSELPRVKEFEPKISYGRVLLMKYAGWLCALLSPIQIALSTVFPAFWLIVALFRITWAVLFYLTVSKTREVAAAAYDMGEVISHENSVHE